jgi:hypothetical protein
MRILKYIFLLLLLFLIGLTVFVTTQKGDFDITRSKVIKANRTTIYNFVNDYRNWETFGSWVQDDPKMKFIYPGITSGKGASYSWKGDDGEGSMKTIAVKENDSIKQQMVYDDATSEVFWTFKDTLGATKVSWRIKGKMNAMTKLYTFFKGGVNAIIGEMYEKSLVNLDRTLDYELNTFSVKVNGIVNRPKNFYLHQTINSYDDKVTKNIKVLVPKMIRFFEKNKMVMNGKPFVLYNKTNGNIVNFSVCIPTMDSIYIMPGSDLSSGKIEAMTALKTTLTGDYSHLKVARSKAIEYIQKNNLKQNSYYPIVEVYSKTIQDVKFPSKWITELYIPVFPKATVIKPVNYRAKDSASTVQTPSNNSPEEIPVN